METCLPFFILYCPGTSHSRTALFAGLASKTRQSDLVLRPSLRNG